jgi:hypothetical protein
MVGCYTGIQNSSGWKAETSCVDIGNGTKQWGLLLRYKTMVLKISKRAYNL